MLMTLLGHLAGCTTQPGFKKGAETAAIMSDAQRELRAAKIQTEETTTLLSQLGPRPNVDLPTQLSDFRAAVSRTESQFDAARESMRSVNRQGDAFLQDWANEIALMSNQDLRQRSEARKQNLVQSFSETNDSMDSVEGGYSVFMSDLRDVERFLGVDLTPEGIAELSGTIAQTNADSQRLQGRIDVVISHLARVATELPSN
jgi:hypothetical protein